MAVNWRALANIMRGKFGVTVRRPGAGAKARAAEAGELRGLQVERAKLGLAETKRGLAAAGAARGLRAKAMEGFTTEERTMVESGFMSFSAVAAAKRKTRAAKEKVAGEEQRVQALAGSLAAQVAGLPEAVDIPAVTAPKKPPSFEQVEGQRLKRQFPKARSVEGARLREEGLHDLKRIRSAEEGVYLPRYEQAVAQRKEDYESEAAALWAGQVEAQEAAVQKRRRTEAALEITTGVLRTLPEKELEKVRTEKTLQALGLAEAPEPKKVSPELLKISKQFLGYEPEEKAAFLDSEAAKVVAQEHGMTIEQLAELIGMQWEQPQPGGGQ